MADKEKKANNTVEYIQFACRENIVQTDYNYVIIKKETYGKPFDQTGDNVKISMQTAKYLMTQEMINVPCLPGLRIGLTYDAKCPQMILRFSDVKFNCSKELQTEKRTRGTNRTAFEKICHCADQMRNGNCKYQIGRKLFPNAYRTKVFLMVRPKGNEKPEKIQLCEWTDEQKANFLNTIRNYTPINGLVTNNCYFNVLYDSSVINAYSFTVPREFTPTHPKNKPNELIIEITPDENPFCGVSTPHSCMDCLQKNKCPSPFISNMIPITLLSQGK